MSDTLAAEALAAWTRERMKEKPPGGKTALLKSAAAALKAAMPMWTAAHKGDDRPPRGLRAIEVWTRNPQGEFAEACAEVAMECDSAAEETSDAPESAVARAAQRLGDAVFAADGDDLDHAADLIAEALGALAQLLGPEKLRAAIPTLPGAKPAEPAPAPVKKTTEPGAVAAKKLSEPGAAPAKTISREEPKAPEKPAPDRKRMDQTERADGDAHKLLFALREAERYLVPDHLDIPDHALLLTDEERDAAVEAIKNGDAPEDLRALVAKRRKDQTGPVEAPSLPSARKTIGDEAPREERAPARPPAPSVSEVERIEAVVRGRELLPVQPRVPEPEPASNGVRAIGAVWLIAFGLAGWALVTHALGRELMESIENTRLRTLLQALAVALPGYPALLGLLALLTGRQPSGRSLPLDPNPLGVPFEPWWFESLATLTWREVKAVFARATAYIGMFVFLTMNGVLFMILLEYYGGTSSFNKDFELPATYWVQTNFWLWLSIVLLCPAITMRLLAEEAQLGTLESLLTAPVTHIQVVLAKFLGGLSFYAGLLAVSGGYVAILSAYSPEWDWGPVLGGYLGLLLLGGLFLSIGLFTSSITRSQVIAFILSALMCLLLWLVPWFLVSQVDSDVLRGVLNHVHVQEHVSDLARGVLHWRTLVFFLTSTTFFLFLAVRGVSSHTWR